MATAVGRLGVSSKVSRFVLPICTTINMNGCAAFILVTSLFVMQNGGTTLTLPGMLLWVLIAVIRPWVMPAYPWAVTSSRSRS
jgi:Na+/H+-dicarboxylate symporter